MIAAALFVLAAAAQAPTPKHVSVGVKLSDGFAKAALMAVSATRSDMREPTVKAGQVLIPKDTGDKIDAADAEAVSGGELQMTQLLRSAYLTRLLNNLRYETEWKRTPSADLIEQQRQRREREAACFEELESALRARQARQLKSCADAAEVSQK